MRPNKFQKISQYLRVIFGVCLIAFLIYKIPLAQTFKILRDAPTVLVTIAVVIIGLESVICSLKLQLLVKLKNEKITFYPVIRAYYIGFFFNNFMPTDIGGDICKINELKKNDLELRDATQAVIIERLTGIFALIILTLFLAMPGIGMFTRFTMAWLQTPFLISGLLLFAGLAVAYVTWSTFLKSYLKQKKDHFMWNKVYNIIEGFYVYRNNLRILFQALILSLLFHFLGAVSILVLTASVGNLLPFTSSLMIIPVVSFVSLLPISIGALGVKEGALVFCLIRLGLDAPASLGVALLLRFSIYIHSGIGGLLYILGRKKQNV